METVGQRLTQKRNDSGLSQQKVADSLGKTRQMVGKYEDGSSEPGLEELRKMAGLYGCTVAFLIGESGDGSPPIIQETAKETVLDEVREEFRAVYEKVIDRLEQALAKSEERETWYQEQLGKPLLT